jgi:HTH-type transcriptional regulator / antitoxin HigA
MSHTSRLLDRQYALDMDAPTTISSERQHEHYLAVLDRLVSKARRSQSEEKYAELLVTLIEAYEEEHFDIADAAPVDVLRSLMEANHLRQKDLAPVFGSESIVSEVLNGKRELNRTQIEKLSRRFGISPAVFF